MSFHFKKIIFFVLIFSTIMLYSSLGQQIMLTTEPDGRLLYTNMDASIVQDEIILKAGSASEKAAAGSPPPHIEKLINQISEQHGVDPDLVKAVAKVESNYNPNAISYKGAQGLMQLIPETAKRFGVKNVYDPKQNIEGGVKYLKFLSDMFPDNLANILAAYNAGENAVLRHGGIPPIAETQSYVRRITRLYQPKYNKKGTVETAQNESEKSIMRYMDPSGRVVYTNVESSF